MSNVRDFSVGICSQYGGKSLTNIKLFVANVISQKYLCRIELSRFVRLNTLLYGKMKKVTLNEIEYKRAAAKACELAKFLLAGDRGYLENVLEMAKVGGSLVGEVWNTEFHVFGAIASDTDHLPMRDVRLLCSSSMLEKSDTELRVIIEAYRVEVEKACNEVLAKYQSV